MKVFVIAGHGKSGLRNDDGAVFGGTTERTEVVEIAKELAIELRSHGIEVVEIGVDERLTVASQAKKVRDLSRDGDISVSIHLNSASNPSARGVETWYDDKIVKSKSLAKIVNDSLAKESKMPNRGIKVDTTNRWGRLGIVSDIAPCTGILVECGFLSNEVDRGILTDPTKDNVFSVGIAKGILEYLGIEYTPNTPPAWYLDVPSTVWYYDDLKLCVDQGIFIIPTNGLFKPSSERVEMAVVIARHLRSHHASH